MKGGLEKTGKFQRSKCRESDSPLRGRIHLGGLSLRPTSTLLQSGGGPYSNNSRQRLLIRTS
jgi:hypothetical protein